MRNRRNVKLCQDKSSSRFTKQIWAQNETPKTRNSFWIDSFHWRTQGEGALIGQRAHQGSKFFHFHAVFGKSLNNLISNTGPVGGHYPGSATAFAECDFSGGGRGGVRALYPLGKVFIFVQFPVNMWSKMLSPSLLRNVEITTGNRIWGAGRKEARYKRIFTVTDTELFPK